MGGRRASTLLEYSGSVNSHDSPSPVVNERTCFEDVDFSLDVSWFDVDLSVEVDINLSTVA
jgi:hypothetical protein